MSKKAIATIACGLSLMFSGCTLIKKPMDETITTSAAQARKPHMPANVMKDESDVRKFLNKVKGDVRFKGMELVRVLDASKELNIIKEKLSKIPNIGPLFHPPPIVASFKGGALCPFFGEGIQVQVLFEGKHTPAFQVHDSNLCIVCYQNETEQSILHEIIHYLHQRASGGRIKFNKNGRIVETAMPSWISEGFPATIYRESLSRFEKESYDDYTNLLKLIGEIAQDEQIASEAFLFGDLRRLQQVVDKKLGNGIFERTLAKASSSANNGIMEALDFLYLARLKVIQKRLKLLEEEINGGTAKTKLPKKKLDGEAK